jgi:hypothetical protein
LLQRQLLLHWQLLQYLLLLLHPNHRHPNHHNPNHRHQGGTASSFTGSVAPSSAGGGGSLRLVFFFGGILFTLLVTENNNISNDVGNSNHGKWRDTRNSRKEKQ